MSYIIITFKDLKQPSDFLDMTPKTQTTKANIIKWGCIKLRHFETAKETTNKLKKTTYVMGENIAIHISVKG